MFKDYGQAAKGFGGPDQRMKYAKGVNFLISKQNIVSVFKNNKTPPEIILALDKLPDKNCNSSQDLISGLTGNPGVVSDNNLLHGVFHQIVSINSFY